MKRVSLYTGIISLIAMGMFFVPSTASAYEATKIKPNFIKVNANKYRRAGAESAQLSAIGSKKGRVGKVPLFIRKQFWNAGALHVTQDTVLTLTSEQTNTLCAEGHTSAGTTSASASGCSTSSINGNMVLAKYSLSDNEIISKINGLSKNKRKQIKKIKKGRIITSVWLLISGDEQQSGNYSGTFTIADTSNSGTMTLTHSSNSHISFSPNTIIAYEYKKLKWKKGKKVKKLVRDGVWR